jgi:hypothetical protein
MTDHAVELLDAFQVAPFDDGAGSIDGLGCCVCGRRTIA